MQLTSSNQCNKQTNEGGRGVCLCLCVCLSANHAAVCGHDTGGTHGWKQDSKHRADLV